MKAVVWVQQASRILGMVAAGALFAVVGLNVYGVVMRYGLRSPTAWSLELPELLFIVVIAFCLADAQRYRKHVRVEIVSSRLPGNIRSVTDILASVVMVGYCAVVAWALWHRLGQYITLNEVTFQTRIPLAPFALAIVIGVALLGLQVIINRRQETKEEGFSEHVLLGKETGRPQD